MSNIILFSGYFNLTTMSSPVLFEESFFISPMSNIHLLDLYAAFLIFVRIIMPLSQIEYMSLVWLIILSSFFLFPLLLSESFKDRLPPM